jgi:hypothetical protein
MIKGRSTRPAIMREGPPHRARIHGGVPTDQAPEERLAKLGMVGDEGFEPPTSSM